MQARSLTVAFLIKALRIEARITLRLIILNQFFYPDYSATSQLMTDLAESLVAEGVEVTALAGRVAITAETRFLRASVTGA